METSKEKLNLFIAASNNAVKKQKYAHAKQEFVLVRDRK